MRAESSPETQDADFDVVVLGGAFSGSASAILLKRAMPDLRVLVVERVREFNKKVGESTSEVGGCFLTKMLHMTGHLSARHYQKHGLRLWHSRDADTAIEDCTESGPKFQARLPTYQLDRSVFDPHLLGEAEKLGCRVMRPATVKQIDLTGEGAAPHRLVVRDGDKETHTVTARWIIDASGKATVLARKLGLRRELGDEHPTSSAWCRFRNVNDLDSYASRSSHANLRKTILAARTAATNHLMGDGWWCWIIPLSDGTFSTGIVWDRRVFDLPEGPNFTERLHDHLRSHPIGRLMFDEAEPVEKDTYYYKGLSYFSEQMAGNRWVIVGDAMGFIDPLYSQGLDYCGHTVVAATEMVKRGLRGECVTEARDYLNAAYKLSYRQWFEALYKDKYHYMGDAQLMYAAFLMDLACYFIGPVRLVYTDPDYEWTRMPYDGPAGTVFARFMAFYNRRLVAIAKSRKERGAFGVSNAGRTFVVPGSFTPGPGALRQLLVGIRIWLGAELGEAMAKLFRSSAKPEAGQETEDQQSQQQDAAAGQPAQARESTV
jgi:flavin-dependent dehydrogenase